MMRFLEGNAMYCVKAWRKVVLSISSGLLLLVAFPVFADGEDEGVTVRVNEAIELRYEQPVRLSQILNDATSQWAAQESLPPLNVHWPSARLIHIGQVERIERKRLEVLNELESLASRYQNKGKPEKHAAVEELMRQVHAWDLGYQPWAELNFERSRQTLDANPLVHSGHYHLILPERPQTVYLYGLNSEAGPRQFNPEMDLRKFLLAENQRNQFVKGHDRDYAYVVRQNSSEAEKLPWSYHNATGERLQPGNIIWVGFGRWELPWGQRHLNDDIVALLHHWVADEGEITANDYMVQQPANMLMEGADWLIDTNQHWQQQDYNPSRNNFGGAGLMQTPTARMAPEGQLTAGYYDMDEYRRYSVSLQVLSWLETTAFYARLPNRLYSPVPEFSNFNIYTDKGFDVKARVLKESYWFPELAIGLRDFAGTGIFDSEFVVANKRLGPLDVSLGVGTGRMGTRDNISNPFCELSDRYCDRREVYAWTGGGGKPEVKQWFTGPMALFGGIEYQTPYQPLRLKLEYDSNDYSRDFAGVRIRPQTPWNFGVNYRVTDWLDLQASYERGDTLMLGFNVRMNFNALQSNRVERNKVQPRDEPRYADLDSVRWRRINDRLFRQRVYMSGRYYSPDDDVVRVYANPLRYRDPDEMIDRTARVLAADLPESIKTYEIVEQSPFEPQVLTRVNADDFKATIRNEVEGRSVDDTQYSYSRHEPGLRPSFDDENWLDGRDYRFTNNYGLRPFFNQDLGSPETFHFYQLGVGAFANRFITPNLEIFGEVGINLANNYDRFNFNVDAYWSPLPRVRTWIREYVTNDVWMDRLEANYYKKLNNEVYGMVYAGYLERMFAGAGGEVLWRPLDQPWAVGLDVARVRQRDFDGWEGFRDYETTTGFVNVYYQMPWLEDSLLALSFGQFLAGDRGVNVNFQRRFDSGVIVGAYAAFTDASTEDYGEGSFTKGFFMTIPFDLIGIRPTRQRVSFSWTPLNRDGGQMLQRRTSLYGITDARSPFYSR